ncbi:MAG: hypothetical protein V4813_12060 [Gemmatimonadota bacterium]
MRTRSTQVRSSLARTPRADAALVAGSAVIALATVVAVRQGGTAVWWMAGACAVLAALVLLRPQLGSLGLSSAAERHEVSMWGLRTFDGDQLRDSVSWADLEEVALVTAPRGARADESYLVLRGTSGNGVIVSHAVAAAAGVLSALPAHVPEFSAVRLSAAMASPDDGVHIVWRAPQASVAHGDTAWQVHRWEQQFAH